MSTLDALAWCRLHNAFVRFESDGTVTIKVGEYRRRRPTLVDAVDAMRKHPGVAR